MDLPVTVGWGTQEYDRPRRRDILSANGRRTTTPFAVLLENGAGGVSLPERAYAPTGSSSVPILWPTSSKRTLMRLEIPGSCIVTP